MNAIRLATCAAAGVLLLAGLARGADSPLADAAERQDQATVRKLLADKVDANAAQPDGMTALHWAAYHDDAESVQLLLAGGANAKGATRYGVTPLSLACTNGNTKIVET